MENLLALMKESAQLIKERSCFHLHGLKVTDAESNRRHLLHDMERGRLY